MGLLTTAKLSIWVTGRCAPDTCTGSRQAFPGNRSTIHLQHDDLLTSPYRECSVTHLDLDLPCLGDICLFLFALAPCSGTSSTFASSTSLCTIRQRSIVGLVLSTLHSWIGPTRGRGRYTSSRSRTSLTSSTAYRCGCASRLAWSFEGGWRWHIGRCR